MADSSEPRAYVLLDSSEASAPLVEVLTRMAAEGVRYACVDYGAKLVAYGNDAIAEALERGTITLDGVIPYRTWAGHNSEFLTLDVRKAVGICSNNHSTPAPPAYLGGTCRCSKKIVLIV